MDFRTSNLRGRARIIVATALILGLYAATRGAGGPSAAERARMAARFGFQVTALPTVPGPPIRHVRDVNPSYKRIDAWISSVGAAAGIGDLDGNGLSDDICYVDTRTDQVIVTPAPVGDSLARYKPFVLNPEPLPFDRATMAPMGALIGDFNEDGLPDVLVYYWGRTPILFLQESNAGRTLSSDAFVRRELLPPGKCGDRWFTNAALQADLDGDGHADVVFGNYFPDGAHVLDANAMTREMMSHSMSRAANGGLKHFLLWKAGTTGGEPTATFAEATPELKSDTDRAEVFSGWTLALGAQDLDGDLLPELYIANDFGPDRLLHNESTPGKLRFRLAEGRVGFMTPKYQAVGHDSFKGMGVDFADLNGDGVPDIFVSNITTDYALHESNFVYLSNGDMAGLARGVAPYREASTSLGLPHTGWCWDARFGDFDNSGTPQALQAVGFIRGTVNRWPQLQELAMGSDEALMDTENWPIFHPGDDLCGHQHNPFYVRASDGRFYDLAAEVGLGDSHISRGIATADVDGDGRLDLVVANQWEDSLFCYNTATHPGAFLGLRLLLPAMNGTPGATRPAFGAMAEVTAGDKRLVAQVDGGNGHSGKCAPELHVGLGAWPTDRPVRVRLRWRDIRGAAHEETQDLRPGWHTVLLTTEMKEAH